MKGNMQEKLAQSKKGVSCKQMYHFKSTYCAKMML